VQEEFGSFDRYIWDFVDGRPLINRFQETATSRPNRAIGPDQQGDEGPWL